MITIARALGGLAQEFIGRWWWQIPLLIGSLGLIWAWDSARIAKHVEIGKWEVKHKIEEADNAAVAEAERVRDLGTSERLRKLGKRDPYSID